MDAKSVMSGLEGLTECDWRMYHSDSEVRNIARDALTLLKEQGADKEMDKMRIENSELIQRVLQLEKELERERSYNYAIVTVIKNNYPT